MSEEVMSEREVWKELQKLFDLLEKIDTNIQNLESELDPILLPKQDQVKKSETECESKLGKDLRSLIYGFDDVEFKIQELIRRLAI